MHKTIILGLSALLSLGLAGAVASQPSASSEDMPAPQKKKGEPSQKGAPKKDEPGPAGDLRRAYDLLRRIKIEDGPSGRSDERLRDWTERAAKFYRKGVQAESTGEKRQAHEYGAAAHDLARAVDHVRNASMLDRPDADLPPPPDQPGPGGDEAEARRDLRRAYDRILEFRHEEGSEAKFYLDAARDLYNAARRDVQGERLERAGELAKAAEAMTHVPEHLAHLNAPEPEGSRARPESPKEKKEKAERPEPKPKKAERPEADDLPPALPTVE
jgi:hypothetical protein